MNEHDSKEQKLATIERRFQFVLLVALLGPIISPDIVKIFPNMVAQMGVNGETYSEIILAYVLLDYFFLECFRKLIRSKHLDWIADSLFVLSFALVAVTGLAATYTITMSSGWRTLLLSIMMFVSVVLPFILGLIIIWSPATQWLKKMWPKKKIRIDLEG